MTTPAPTQSAAYPPLTDVVTREEEVRAILGRPVQRVIDKVIPYLDDHCRAFIAKSPFLLIASADAHGRLDVSPKGDPAGFVQVLDDQTLVIPDRPGNRRADTLVNLIQHPQIGLIFLVPGKEETLRVNGRARIVRDEWLRARLAVRGKLPDLAIVVTVEEAYMHCAKCMIRSQLWHAEEWGAPAELPSLAAIMIDHAKLTDDLATVQAQIDESIRDRLY